MGPSENGPSFIRQSMGPVLIFASLIALTFFVPAWLNLLGAEVALAGVLIATFWGGTRSGLVGMVVAATCLLAISYLVPGVRFDFLELVAAGATGLVAVGLMEVLERRSRQSLLKEKLARVERERQEAMAQLDLMEARSNRVELLGEAGVILASSMDLHSTLRKVCDLLVMRLSDWSAIEISEETGLALPPIVFHRDESKTAMTEELQNYPLRFDHPYGAAKVISTGEAELYPSVPRDLINQITYDSRHKEILNALGFASVIIVPLRARGNILGTITLARSESSPRYDKTDLDLAQEFADRVALATDNIRLYESQKHIATTLQESLRPRLVERIPGTEVAVRYAAAGQGVDVGGDFYDVFSYGQTRWAVVVGDVSGRGARAAALTPLLKYTIRTEAMQEHEPSRILTLLNEAMLQQSGEDQFCTVAYTRIDPKQDGVHITTVCAGHPTPLILRSDGAVERLGEPGTMLGAVPEVQLAEHRADLRSGDAIVLFTDGVIEARRDGENFGDARLYSCLRECVGIGAEEIADTLERAIIDYSQGSLTDDMVILVVKLTAV